MRFLNALTLFAILILAPSNAVDQSTPKKA
jgi:hypothetical protein